MNILSKILAVLCFQIAGFIAAVLGFEIFKLLTGTAYTVGIWGLDIPYIYQTKEIYIYYCIALGIWFLTLSVLGVFSLLKKQITLMLVYTLIVLISIFLVVFFNGRFA